MTTSTDQMIAEALSYGKEFLYREELRALRNLYWLPLEMSATIIDNLKIDIIYKVFIYSWISECKVPDNIMYYVLPNDSTLDAYENCYDNNYNLTTLGQEMHDAAAAVVTDNG